MTIEGVIFYLLLLDSASANCVSLWGQKWYFRHFRIISRWFPPAQGWVVYYLVLVLWIGSLVYRAGGLGF